MQEKIIKKISYEYFKERKHLETLEFELSPNDHALLKGNESKGYTIVNGKLIFSSQFYFEEQVIGYYLDSIDFTLENVGHLIIRTALDIWQISLRGNQSLAGLFLSKCEGRVNILREMGLYNEEGYKISLLADQYIKYASFLDVENISKLMWCIYSKNDNYVGDYSELRSRLSTEPVKCREFIDYIYSDITNSNMVIYNIALLALRSISSNEVIDILLKDIAGGNELITQQAFWVLSSIDEDTFLSYKQEEVVEVIKAGITSSSVAIEKNALHAAINLMDKSKELYTAVLCILEDNNIIALELLSQKISRNKGLMECHDFPLWVERICDNVNHSQTLREMSIYILSSLFENGSMHDFALSNFFTILKRVDYSGDDDYLLSQLIKNEDVVNKLMTLSLLSNEPAIADFSQKLSVYLMVNRYQPLVEFHTPIIKNFSEQDFVFLVRRMLGFISDEKHLLSMTLSLLKVPNMMKRSLPLVQLLVINELAMDYPDYIMKEMNKIVDSLPRSAKKTKLIYNEIILQVKKYIDSFHKLPAVKEFEPSKRYVISFQKERNKALSRAQDGNGGIMQIFANIQLKAGKGSFYYDEFNQRFSEPSMLHGFSSSYSLPRRYVMDNVGHEISICLYRMVKKGEK